MPLKCLYDLFVEASISLNWRQKSTQSITNIYFYMTFLLDDSSLDCGRHPWSRLFGFINGALGFWKKSPFKFLVDCNFGHSSDPVAFIQTYTIDRTTVFSFGLFSSTCMYSDHNSLLNNYT